VNNIESNDFYEYFSQQFSDETQTHDNEIDLELNSNPQTCATFTFNEITQEFVTQFINRMPNNKSTGFDNFNVKIIKFVCEYITPFLVTLINASLKFGIFPENWKKAKVIPIFKKSGSKDNCANYRPISVLPILSKVIEKFVEIEISEYLSLNNLLNKMQFGFKKSNSTTDALLFIKQQIITARNENNYCAVINLDLKKAFDSVPHHLLILKLFRLGFDDISLNWFRTYLSDRKQYVYWKKKKSNEFILNRGVPQGSILGAKLFCIYIDDILLLPLKGKLVLYADDSTLICKAKTIESLEEAINSDLLLIHNWLERYKLAVNKSKSNYILFGSTQEINVYFDESLLIRVSEAKILGIYFDYNLSFAKHIEYVDKKVNNHIRLIGRIRHFVPLIVRNTICRSLMFPIMTYGIQIWGHTYDQHLKSLEVSQKTAAKIITFSRIGTNSGDIFKKLKWLSIKESVNYFSSVYIFKSLKRLNSINSSEFFILNNSQQRTRSTAKDQLKIPLFKRQYMQNSIFFKGVKFFNNLPLDIRSSTNIKVFIKNLKLHFSI
jgi:hypothetical protein